MLLIALVTVRALTVPAFLKRVAQVNDCSQAPTLLPLLVDGAEIGSVSPKIIDALKSFQDVFDVTSGTAVTLSRTLEDAPFEERNAKVHEVAIALHERGLITKWRDETLAMVTSFDAAPSLLVERRLVPLLGGRGYGVAVNGFSRHPASGALHLWVATRAADKATWPGMLDTLAAGAMSAGGSALEAARAEAAEEAGIPDSLAASLRAVGAVSYRGIDEDPVLPKHDVFFCFDLELPWRLTPVPVDGEVASFERLPLSEVARCVAYGASPSYPCLVDGEEEESGPPPNAFKPNINLVVIDFLVRHGFLDPSEPGYLELVASLRQGRCN